MMTTSTMGCLATGAKEKVRRLKTKTKMGSLLGVADIVVVLGVVDVGEAAFVETRPGFVETARGTMDIGP